MQGLNSKGFQTAEPHAKGATLLFLCPLQQHRGFSWARQQLSLQCGRVGTCI